jgi:hypothetical protein
VPLVFVRLKVSPWTLELELDIALLFWFGSLTLSRWRESSLGLLLGESFLGLLLGFQESWNNKETNHCFWIGTPINHGGAKSHGLITHEIILKQVTHFRYWLWGENTRGWAEECSRTGHAQELEIGCKKNVKTKRNACWTHLSLNFRFEILATEDTIQALVINVCFEGVICIELVTQWLHSFFGPEDRS